MICFILAFFLGVNALHFLENLPSSLTIILIVSVLILLQVLLYALITLIKATEKSKKTNIKKPKNAIYFSNHLRIISCFIFYYTKISAVFIGFICGFIYCYFSAYQVFQCRLPVNLEGVPLFVKGTIVSIPEVKNGIVNFEFLIQTAAALSADNIWNKPGKVKLSWREIKTEAIQVGDQWQFTIKLKRPHGYANPGSFDKERQYFQNRLVAQGYIIYDKPPQLLNSSWFHRTVDRVRTQLRDEMRCAFNKMNHAPFAGLVEALVIGTRDRVTDAQWLVFQNTGTAHLMAISGLHVGMVASVAFLLMVFILKKLPIHYFNKLSFPVTCCAAFIALAIALFYAALAGFSIPTQRAIVMISLLMTNIVFKRKTSTWRSYCIALWVVLLLDPLAPLGVGFWLSFAAVGLMLYGMQKRIAITTLWWKWGRAQWVVFLGLMPLSIWSFQKFSLVSPLVNSIAIPWVSWFVVPFALLGCFLSIFFSSLASLPLCIAEKMLQILWPFLEYFSEMAHATLNSSMNSFIGLIIATIGMLWILAPKGFPGRGLGLICLIALFWSPKEIPSHSALISVLDVGQGLSIVVETAKHTLLFDTGPKLNDSVNAGNRVILPFLVTRNIHKIDTLIISHGDLDHIGGADSILKSHPIDKIMTSEPWLFEEAEYCKAGQHWEWDNVMFDMLHPSEIDEPYYKKNAKRNDQSCVLRIQAGNHSVLITGDIETKSEKRILTYVESIKTDNLKQGENTEKIANTRGVKQISLKSTILLVPHHGSKSSSSEAFIDAVSPHFAVIPVGYRNAYGHPKKEVVERYENRGIQVLDSVKGGAIQFLLEDKNELPLLKQYRLEHKHYWSFKE